jgi:hypothetical protein
MNLKDTCRGLILFLLLSLASAVFAQTVVVPNARENTERPSENVIPFGTNFFAIRRASMPG